MLDEDLNQVCLASGHPGAHHTPCLSSFLNCKLLKKMDKESFTPHKLVVHCIMNSGAVFKYVQFVYHKCVLLGHLSLLRSAAAASMMLQYPHQRTRAD